MKKLLLFVASVVASLSTTALAVTTPPFGQLVVNADFSNGQTPFTNGKVVALQCVDTNGGDGWFFHGAAAKSVDFSTENLYRVVTAGDRFKLQNVLNPDQYVGKASEAANALTVMTSSDNAETFTAAIATPTNWTSRSAGVEGGVNTVRFTASHGLLWNTNDKASTPKFFDGTGGYSIWYVYTFADEDVDKLINGIEVTLNFTGINNESLTTTFNGAISLDINEYLSNHCPEFFTATGVTESNTTIADDNKNFHVNGTWDFPFTLNKVFRADLRKSASQSCTKWTVRANDTISTRNNANVDHFQPENLFYLRGHGYDANNRLQVTLHTIAREDSKGFYTTTENNYHGKFSDTPTTWVVKINSTATATDKGISLQHSDNTNAHVNDISGDLGLWTAAASQNDGGSFIRFFDLTDEDFQTAAWTAEDSLGYFLDATKMAAAKANPTSENVRAAFTKDRIATKATLTVRTVHDGHVLATNEFNDYVGNPVTVNAPTFFNDEPYSGTIPQGGDTVDYVLTQLELPFAYTETTDNMRWQAIQIHTTYANNQGYTWTYTEANSNTMVAHQPADKATNGFADTQLWAFVGNMADGFKIYNKEAGLNMWLYEDGTASGDFVKVGTTQAGSIWKPGLSRTNTESATYCCLSTNGTNYINLNVAANNATALNHWSDNDNGSTCWFTAAAEPLIAAVNNLKYLADDETYTGPTNAVGAILVNEGVDLTTRHAILEAANANKYSYESVEALRDFIALYNSNVIANQLQPNGYYRIANIHWADNYMFADHSDNKFYGSHYSGQDYRSNYGTIFQFESVPDQANRYYLQSQGVYVGHVTGTGNATTVQTHEGPVQATEVADRGEYALVQENHDNMVTVNTCAAFALKDMTQTDVNSLHQGSNAGTGKTEISAWREFAHGSHFYVLKAEDIEVALDQPHDGMNFGFGYFPFPVHATDADTKFYYVHESNNKKTGDAVITYTERDGATVPAHTPVMIGHKESTSVVLAIGNAPEAANARRRAISAEGNNTIAEGTQETDTWTGTSWTNATADEVPEGIKALGVTVANVKYMARTITFADGGDLSVDFEYTSGNARLDICGVNLTDAEGNVVASDYHTGFSGNQKVNKVYNLKVPAAGTYTLRYYTTNTNMSTNGNIFIDFTCKDKTPLLAGHLKATTAEAGDLVLGRDSDGNLAFVKTTEATAVKGNYVTLPTANLYDAKLAAATEIPLVNRNETTEIEELTAKQPAASNVVYDLQGRRLAAPVKGINIVNGKKVLVK